MNLRQFIPLHNSLVKKYHVNPVKKKIIEISNGNVLDVGCGEKPFYKYIKDKTDEYIGFDHPDTPHDKQKIDVFGTADNLPFNSNYFDVVILTQVIEHMEDPSKTLDEIYRVLKPGGKLILAWPFMFPVHEAPRDFYRYTSYGMEYLAKQSNFSEVQINPSSGFWITVFGFLSIYLMNKSIWIYLLFYIPLLFLKGFCITMNMLDVNKKSRAKWTWNYFAVFSK